jgi:DNA-binding NarL/FixJ family response regulator
LARGRYDPSVPAPILVAVKDLLFRSKIELAAKSAGVAIAFAPRGRRLSDVAAESRPGLLIADLAEPGALDELAAIREALPGAHLIGYAGHLEGDLLARAQAIGVDEILSKGQLSATLGQILLRTRSEGA